MLYLSRLPEKCETCSDPICCCRKLCHLVSLIPNKFEGRFFISWIVFLVFPGSYILVTFQVPIFITLQGILRILCQLNFKASVTVLVLPFSIQSSNSPGSFLLFPNMVLRKLLPIRRLVLVHSGYLISSVPPITERRFLIHHLERLSMGTSKFHLSTFFETCQLIKFTSSLSNLFFLFGQESNKSRLLDL